MKMTLPNNPPGPLTQVPTLDLINMVLQLLHLPPSLPAMQQFLALLHTIILQQPIALPSTQQPVLLPTMQQPIALLAHQSVVS